MTLCWTFLCKTKLSVLQQRVFGAWVHTAKHPTVAEPLLASQLHGETRAATAFTKGLDSHQHVDFQTHWQRISAPKAHTTAECYRQLLPSHQSGLVSMDLISNEIREQAGKALAAFSFNERKSLCTNTACKTFCFWGQVYCPHTISIWQRKEYALSSFCWMQPQSKITSEVVNNNFESISRIV